MDEQESITERNKALARRVVEEIWGQGRLDTIDEVYDTTYVAHIRGPGGTGCAGFKRTIGLFRQGFPDAHTQVMDMITEGDRVVVIYQAEGTHQGSIFGETPSRRAVNVTGISVMRISHGKIVETWDELDLFGLAQQLGLVPRLG